MTEEIKYVNGLVLEKGEHPKLGKLCAVMYGDGCLAPASYSFEVGDVLKSQIIPLKNGKHEHDIIGKVLPAGKKPATLTNQQADHASQSVTAQSAEPAATKYEYNLSPEDAAALEAAMRETGQPEPISGGKPLNPFNDSFEYTERSMSPGRKEKPIHPFDDPRGGGPQRRW
ncbi:MAG TPA: hypothetical protein VG075_04440 [Candidatus Acidoferrum sp.]|jgi:hypothetical protein|nr:hypothetical protein [Candidatus Acidoferrum sp.]